MEIIFWKCIYHSMMCQLLPPHTGVIYKVPYSSRGGSGWGRLSGGWQADHKRVTPSHRPPPFRDGESQVPPPQTRMIAKSPPAHPWTRPSKEIHQLWPAGVSFQLRQRGHFIRTSDHRAPVDTSTEKALHTDAGTHFRGGVPSVAEHRRTEFRLLPATPSIGRPPGRILHFPAGDVV